MLAAQYFDGRHARGQPVHLRIAAGELLATTADGGLLRWPLRVVQWPERTRHGQRVLELPGGAQLQVADATAFDAWRRQAGLAESWVVRAQQNWRATAAAVLGLVLVLLAGYQWGVPAASQALVAVVPLDVDRAVGDSALRQLEERWLKPSALPAERQAALRLGFEQLVRAAYPAGDAPPHQLRFAQATEVLGPNAFALPGGTIVITDALVKLLDGADDTVLGVLAHELGHVRHRHGMKGLVQLTLVGTATSVALGDFSTVLAGLPALLAQMAYSRDAEREADAESARALRAAGLRPAVMAVLFERLPKAREGRPELPIAFASHPLDEERARFFREAR